MGTVLDFSGRRTTPLILQTEATECGLACLAMIAGHHGDQVDLATLRNDHPVSLKGATLAHLLQVASRMSLAARPVKVELEDLARLALPAVLHWDFNHYVVLVRMRGTRAVIHDPASGMRELDIAEVSRHFTGVCLEVAPAHEFRPQVRRRRLSVLDLLGRIRGVRATIAQILLMAAALELFAVLAPLYMQLVVDQAIVAQDRDLVVVLGTGFLLLVLAQVGISAARSWVVMVLGTTLNMQVVTDLFAHLVRLPLSFFEKRHLGDISSRFESLNAIQRTLTGSFIEAIVDGVMAVVTVAVMFAYHPLLASIVLAAVLLYAALRVALYRPLRQAQNEQIAHAARQQSSFLETVRGIQSVKLFNRQQQRSTAHGNLLAESFNAGIRIQRLDIVYRALNGALFGIENIAVVSVGALLVLDGAMSVGMLFAFAAFKLQFVTRAAAVVDKAIDLRMLGLHAERVADIALAEPESEGRIDAVHAGLRADVELRNVSFRYSEFEAPILHGVNLRIEEGESVAIVGPSGCGKTTLLKLILGILKPTEGEVLVGGVDIATLGTRYRDLVGAVMQEDELFAGSVADNICFFDLEPDRQRLEACARLAAIEADILAMPMGYNTLIGDMGTVLSGGQKQRVLLARALYKQPRILALDEATSHLDVDRERSVNEAVRGLKLTRICIAHRAETIAMSGRVIALWGPDAATRLPQIAAVA
ncbi:peptidase domain-containing ABC transporter [Piscinibacter sp. XHJ-5]|uniref:peptidase domain-containing ABC transporter n=1 Tax=Piscinibacter sp. XHJ-5 TaxID=3037797 RepID=UPI002453610B|nr:peptidase domain-containing ABC transporter [Piscinibacter sp. XHJ-5]